MRMTKMNLGLHQAGCSRCADQWRRTICHQINMRDVELPTDSWSHSWTSIALGNLGWQNSDRYSGARPLMHLCTRVASLYVTCCRIRNQRRDLRVGVICSVLCKPVKFTYLLSLTDVIDDVGVTTDHISTISFLLLSAASTARGSADIHTRNDQVTRSCLQQLQPWLL